MLTESLSTASTESQITEQASIVLDAIGSILVHSKDRGDGLPNSNWLYFIQSLEKSIKLLEEPLPLQTVSTREQSLRQSRRLLRT